MGLRFGGVCRKAATGNPGHIGRHPQDAKKLGWFLSLPIGTDQQVLAACAEPLVKTPARRIAPVVDNAAERCDVLLVGEFCWHSSRAGKIAMRRVKCLCWIRLLRCCLRRSNTNTGIKQTALMLVLDEFCMMLPHLVSASAL